MADLKGLFERRPVRAVILDELDANRPGLPGGTFQKRRFAAEAVPFDVERLVIGQDRQRLARLHLLPEFRLQVLHLVGGQLVRLPLAGLALVGLALVGLARLGVLGSNQEPIARHRLGGDHLDLGDKFSLCHPGDEPPASAHGSAGLADSPGWRS